MDKWGTTHVSVRNHAPTLGISDSTRLWVMCKQEVLCCQRATLWVTNLAQFILLILV